MTTFGIERLSRTADRVIEVVRSFFTINQGHAFGAPGYAALAGLVQQGAASTWRMR